jgi:glycine/D-amino acid oxidase-like deaminating enzyme
MIQYELDAHLADLSKKIGEKDAVRVYRLCYEAVKELDSILWDAGSVSEYRRKKSLYLASSPNDVERLKEEHAIRRKHGFDVEYLSEKELERRFSVKRPAALLTPDAAEADPFLLAHHLVQKSVEAGMRVFERTAVVEMVSSENSVLLTLSNGTALRARKVIFATGYEATDLFKKPIVDLYSSYVAVTPPHAPVPAWFHEHLVWETARPYLYLRMTSDGRLLMGGEDSHISDLKVCEQELPEKTKKLLQKTEDLLTGTTLEVDRSWAGIFGTTKDSMPYIGGIEGLPNVYFALCYDANGMTFSVIAGRILLDLLSGRSNDDARIFRFDRHVQ